MSAYWISTASSWRGVRLSVHKKTIALAEMIDKTSIGRAARGAVSMKGNIKGLRAGPHRRATRAAFFKPARARARSLEQSWRGASGSGRRPARRSAQSAEHVGAFERRPQRLVGDVRVDFRRGDARMAE